uniref:Uncharacterized protein LOC110220832 n=1 Tax=Phascolarctos cinereus TaxID=38626 RepID=A0A6P5LQI0_PHACI|nr:uncharacterized protein LOC110220832 [Phascolarctos cinereus]
MERRTASAFGQTLSPAVGQDQLNLPPHRDGREGGYECCSWHSENENQLCQSVPVTGRQKAISPVPAGNGFPPPEMQPALGHSKAAALSQNGVREQHANTSGLEEKAVQVEIPRRERDPGFSPENQAGALSQLHTEVGLGGPDLGGSLKKRESRGKKLERDILAEQQSVSNWRRLFVVWEIQEAENLFYQYCCPPHFIQELAAPHPPPSLSAPVPGLAAARKCLSVQMALPKQAGTRMTPAWRSHIPRQAASAEKLKEIQCFVGKPQRELGERGRAPQWVHPHSQAHFLDKLSRGGG